MSKPNRAQASKEEVSWIEFGVYDQEITESHSFVKNDKNLLKLICDVLKAEGGKGGKEFERKTCYKLDDYDKEKGKTFSRPGVDIAFCLSSRKVLLVEAKLNVTSSNKFDLKFKRKIDEKINGSVGILTENYCPVLRAPYVVVLVQQKSLSRARYHFRNLGGGSQACFQAMTEEEFFKTFFKEEID